MGREFILVAAVDPACEFHRQLRPTDELIAVNGNVICEPQRFGALSRTIYQAERPLRYVGRGPSAAPATGLQVLHQRELRQVLDDAL